MFSSAQAFCSSLSQIQASTFLSGVLSRGACLHLSLSQPLHLSPHGVTISTSVVLGAGVDVRSRYVSCPFLLITLPSGRGTCFICFCSLLAGAGCVPANQRDAINHNFVRKHCVFLITLAPTWTEVANRRQKTSGGTLFPRKNQSYVLGTRLFSH